MSLQARGIGASGALASGFYERRGTKSRHRSVVDTGSSAARAHEIIAACGQHVSKEIKIAPSLRDATCIATVIMIVAG
jgi:hypothetical protein